MKTKFLKIKEKFILFIYAFIFSAHNITFKENWTYLYYLNSLHILPMMVTQVHSLLNLNTRYVALDNNKIEGCTSEIKADVKLCIISFSVVTVPAFFRLVKVIF